MQVIALRLSLLAVAAVFGGLCAGAGALLWLGLALALVGLGAFVAALCGVQP